jgi:hypothetical protein
MQYRPQAYQQVINKLIQELYTAPPGEETGQLRP